jgi:tetratricopeptide (TPR) repeat protein
MKKIFYLISSILLLSCGGSENVEITDNENAKDTIIDTFEERTAEVDKYAALVYGDTTLEFNPEYAKPLLKAYEVYIKHHSFQAISKLYQFKAGELAKALNKPHVAIKHFNDLMERDPDHEKAPIALFYKAMIIGDMLHEDDLAKATYQEFIDKYPDHPFVESAKESIKLQGKSLEEIVAGFEKKNS